MTTKNSFVIFLGIVVAGLIIGGAILYKDGSFSNSQSASGVSILDSQKEQEIDESGHARGNPEAFITIVEFSDFECPYCDRFNQTMKQVMSNYPNDVRWVYSHFPLPDHGEARPAAEASECAAEQGKFWEFHDGLFENQSRLGKELYSELAQTFDLNLEQFEKCLSLRKYRDKVEKNYQDGVAAGIKGTPGNFINNQPIGGAVPFTQLKIRIDNLLSK